jgi:hypothetical protein
MSRPMQSVASREIADLAIILWSTQRPGFGRCTRAPVVYGSARNAQEPDGMRWGTHMSHLEVAIQ